MRLLFLITLAAFSTVFAQAGGYPNGQPGGNSGINSYSSDAPARDCVRSTQCASATIRQEGKKERNHEKLCAEGLRELEKKPQPGTNLKLASCYR